MLPLHHRPSLFVGAKVRLFFQLTKYFQWLVACCQCGNSKIKIKNSKLLMKLFLPITICFFPLIGVSQEAVTDTIALPTLATTDVPKEVDLERVMSKIW